MKFPCIIVSKFSDVPAEHKSAVKSWFFFHFFMLALCVINILFFICNWADLRLQINDTTNILLTIIGSLVGMGIGKILHQFVIVTVEVEGIMFGRNIDFPSFLYSFLFTVGFSLFVNWVMYFKLKRIDMVESLKSAE